MRAVNKRDLIEVIDKSAEDLHQRIDMHRYLMATILEKRVSDEKVKRLFPTLHSLREGRLKEAIKETIEVLERSRKAFKSKRLEVLRKKLTQVLIEIE